ncbi:hypothetical protein [Micromonospora polyrhachis]|nr:hypothetical protein [Micromonospora polyrhachis]
MLAKDSAVQEAIADKSATHTADSTSADRPVGRHRACGSARRSSTSRLAPPPIQLALAVGITGCLGLVAFTGSQAPIRSAEPPPTVLAELTERAMAAEVPPASRATERAPVPTNSPTPRPKPTRTAPPKPTKPKPVAGLTQAQMDNAHTIVQVGVKLKIPRKGLVVAIATAMQESNLYNLASDVLPESKNYPHQGSGADHDSVGLFQQRTSSGWGAVKDLMRPAYAAQKFFEALVQVPGWQQLSMSAAAQAVQVSAFPDAYAQHESRATTIVAALLA